MHSSQICSKSALTLSFFTQECSQFLRNSAALAAPIAFRFTMAICQRCLLYIPKGLALQFYRDKLSRILAQFLETSSFVFSWKGERTMPTFHSCVHKIYDSIVHIGFSFEAILCSVTGHNNLVSVA